jgi:molecular chaperone DnaJ
VLSDSEKRQLYDLYGHAGLADLDLGGFSGFEDIFSSFGDIFEDFFSFGRHRRRPDRAQPGADLRHRVVLTLEDVARGVETSLEVDRRINCPRCGGSGLETGTSRQSCLRCGGRGQVSQSKGQLKIFNTCPQCRGAGSIIPSPCQPCDGIGMIREKTIMQVRIPPGVDAGTRLRLRGKGEAGRLGGKAGDLYLDVQIAPHQLFTRQGMDLYYQARLSFVEAALGTEIEVPTLDSQARLAIPRAPSRGPPSASGTTVSPVCAASPGATWWWWWPSRPRPSFRRSSRSCSGSFSTWRRAPNPGGWRGRGGRGRSKRRFSVFGFWIKCN